jgi:Holliday junction resolvasome RuvABC DNA-binding subunit
VLLHLEEQAEEITKVMANLSDENMRRDAEILTSMKGIGDKMTPNSLIELGGDVRAFENDKKVIAAARARSDYL